MAFTRRGFIKVIGTGSVIVGASAYGFATTRTPEKALAPWDLAGSKIYSDPRMRALSYAILAPNPHNRQPWKVDLRPSDEVILYCDLERLLPETDPPNRQITIGLGCFLELLRMAAAHEGIKAVVTPFPDGAGEDFLDARPVARIRFLAGEATPDPLFRHVMQRRSLKEPFDMQRPVSASLLEEIALSVDDTVQVGTTNTAKNLEDFRDLSWRAWLIETMTPRTMQESVDLMRIGKSEINANPDGIDLGGAFLEGLSLLGQLDRKQLADQKSVAFQQGIDMYKAMMLSAMGYVWLGTETNTRVDQLRSGANWLRVNLKATSKGLGIHPISQALQEYPEMSALYEELHSKLDISLNGNFGPRVQMFARVGYGPTLDKTPRWKIETRVL